MQKYKVVVCCSAEQSPKQSSIWRKFGTDYLKAGRVHKYVCLYFNMAHTSFSRKPC